MLLDKNQGFWLVHSTPHFPPVRQEGQFYYPSSGRNNGQNFICVTYPLERFQTIGKSAVMPCGLLEMFKLNQRIEAGRRRFKQPLKFNLSSCDYSFQSKYTFCRNKLKSYFQYRRYDSVISVLKILPSVMFG